MARIEEKRSELLDREVAIWRDYMDALEDGTPKDPPFFQRIGQWLSHGFTKWKTKNSNWIYTIDRD